MKLFLRTQLDRCFCWLSGFPFCLFALSSHLQFADLFVDPTIRVFLSSTWEVTLEVSNLVFHQLCALFLST
jgi:hypothetical protein